jgi:zinc protease
VINKTARNDAVNFYLQFGLGSASSLGAELANADGLGGLLYAGTEKRTRVELNDATEQLESEVQLFAGADSIAVFGRTTSKHLPALMDLISEALKTPRFDAKELDAWRAQTLAQLEAAKLNPNTQASELMAATTSPYQAPHPLAPRSIDQRIADTRAVTLDGIKSFHQRFVGAQWFQSGFVGEVDSALLSKQLERLYGQWRAPEPYARIVEALNKTVPKVLIAPTPEQANGILMGAQPLALNDLDPDHPALLIGSYIFGGGALDNRLLKRLRQQDGLSYGGGAFLRAGVNAEPVSSLLLFAQAAPENLRASERAAREELKRWAADGVTAEELKDAQSGWLKGRRVQLTNDAQLASTLAVQQEIERTFARSAALEDAVAALDVATVNATLRRRIKPDQWTWVLAGDPKKLDAPAKPNPEKK